MGNQLLVGALQRDHRFKVVGCGIRSEEIISHLAADPQVAVVACDLEKPLGGMDLTRHLRNLHPGLKVVALINSSYSQLVVEAFRSGAKAVFGRDGPLSQLCKCISCVHNGQVWANAKELQFVLQALVESAPPRFVSANGMSLLSQREQAIVHHVAGGLTNRDIATALKLSEHTVKNHLFRIYGKLGVSSRVEIMFAVLSQRTTAMAPKPPLRAKEKSKEQELSDVSAV
jgi:DNA-binding NarL/FixJ family response regulator